MPSRVTIRCLAAYTSEAEENGGGPVPLFVGREDGTVERYDAMKDAELGIPSVFFYAHRRAVTTIVPLSPADLYTCSLDGTVKQWTLEDVEGAASSPPTGGSRVRAVLVRTTTFPFAVHTMILEGNGASSGQQRLYLGGENGSLTLMDGERRTSWPAHDGSALTAIAIDWNSKGSVITGSSDGIIYVWDMESCRPVCELRGHTGPITALIVVPVPPSIPVVRSKRTPAEISIGSFTARPSSVTGTDVLVYADADENSGGDGSASCLLSCSEDCTLKVWLLPDLPDAVAEADLMEQEYQHEHHRQSSEHNSNVHRRSGGISFQEPDSSKEVAGVAEKLVGVAAALKGDADGASLVPAAAATGAVSEDATEEDTAAGAINSPKTAAAESVHEPINPKLRFLQQQASGVTAKSALKAPERRTVPHQSALGTVELPHTPFACSAASSGIGGGDTDDGGSGASSLLFIGAAEGYVYGLKGRRLVKNVCQHRAHNFQKIQQEMRRVQRTLKDGVKVYTKAAATKMREAEAKELKVAAKARQAQLARERAAKKKEAEDRRAARRAAAAAAAEERSEDSGDYDEEDDEEAYMEEEEEEDMEEAEEEEEEEAVMEEEEAEQRGDSAEATDNDQNDVENSPFIFTERIIPPRRPASWKRLTEEQRTALETLFATQEKERDERIAAFRKAVEARLEELRPLAKTPYHRSRDQFLNLPYTTVGCVRDGSAVMSLASSSLVPGYDKVYVTQGNSIAAVSVQFGITKL
ncbi:hypothetical protein JKF63_04283 [Porcisia hertigi]|uniref:Guanine nucleotide-binding protein subunit beta-like protein n=1 Tax=Porcisia hertigi TaxID=2761500 RepID=A0A836L9S3_9TRYP|nr:hypothetical protein JKF63_04283 [Porcisia hertigi]